MKCTGCGIEFQPNKKQRSRGWGYHSNACANSNSHSNAAHQKAGRAGAKASPWSRKPAVYGKKA